MLVRADSRPAPWLGSSLLMAARACLIATDNRSRRQQSRAVYGVRQGAAKCRQISPAPLLFVRGPGLVIAGRARTFAGGERRTRRMPCVCRPGQVRLVRLLPRMRPIALLSGGHVHRVVQPAVP